MVTSLSRVLLTFITILVIQQVVWADQAYQPKDGDVITLECVDSSSALRWLSASSSQNKAVLTGSATTQWTVTASGGNFRLRCAGIQGRAFWLNGLTLEGGLNLIETSDSGSYWTFLAQGKGMALKCLGNREGTRWLAVISNQSEPHLVMQQGTTGTTWVIHRISGTSTSGADPGPQGYTYCAEEGAQYTLPGLCFVAYGGQGKFIYLQNRAGIITFDNSTFGDPLPGLPKRGYYKLIALSDTGPQGYTYCAEEGAQYALRGVCNVAYGAYGKYSYLLNRTGIITFDNRTFGDPLPGLPKKGYFHMISEPDTPNSIRGRWKYWSGGQIGTKDEKVHHYNGYMYLCRNGNHCMFQLWGGQNEYYPKLIISTVKLDGNVLTFTRWDHKFIQYYRGTISGNKITGTFDHLQQPGLKKVGTYYWEAKDRDSTNI